MRRRQNWGPTRPVLAVLIPVALIFGIYLGGHPNSLPGVARDTLVADSDGRLYEEAVDTIERDYYRKVDRKDLLNKSLGAAVQSLKDPFSNYFSPSDYTGFQEQTEGQFEGVGMTVTAVKRGLRVTTVYAGSPAKQGGIKPGDVIVRVNGRALAGKSSDEATALIKGKVGTPVTLTVESGKRSRDIKLKRAKVDVPEVESKMETQNGHKIGWVHLASFTSGAHSEVGNAVRKQISDGAQGIVFDLRGNGGGLLNEAVQIASIFIPDGRIVSTKGRARPEHVYNATGGAISGKIPVVVLVDDHSASASEIVTGALQDRKRATVVGTHTYGKGVFQEIERMSNGGALDITVGEYFTPSGRNLGGGGVSKGAGITPDVQAEDNLKTKPDEALDKALETVASKL
jgi:carboxyl-terminal processing protease